jgi:cellulose biosynthesis protein BcsQ
MTALRTTFYSYKGGVGRTLALLNVAALLASNRRKVVAVDLDLEAPGFGLSAFTQRDGSSAGHGVSDFLKDRLQGGRRDLREFCYRLSPEKLRSPQAELHLVPVGTQPAWLTAQIPQIYSDPSADVAELFLLLLDEIEATLAPDFIFFDSRTGRADIAGVALLELPQVVVAVSALNEQNVGGMRDMLAQLRTHPARPTKLLTLLALSPVPTELLSQRKSDSLLSQIDPDEVPADPRERLLRRRLAIAQADLLAPLQIDFASDVQPWFPDVSDSDLYHVLPYDPIVPLTDELQIVHASELASAYGRLAHVIASARSGDSGLPHLVKTVGPLLP